jgi:hypothetical protein
MKMGERRRQLLERKVDFRLRKYLNQREINGDRDAGELLREMHKNNEMFNEMYDRPR